ncbi:putative CUB domain protein, partial [Trichinella spiralis]
VFGTLKTVHDSKPGNSTEAEESVDEVEATLYLPALVPEV